MRCYDDLGLVPPTTRTSGQRRYGEPAGRDCPAGDPLSCPRFWSIIEGHASGLSLTESHARVH